MSVKYLKKLENPKEKILAFTNRITGKAFPKLSLGEYICLRSSIVDINIYLLFIVLYPLTFLILLKKLNDI